MNSLRFMVVCLLCTECIGENSTNNTHNFSLGEEFIADEYALAYPVKGHKNLARWLIFSSRYVIPGSVFTVVVEALKFSNPDHKSPIEFKASLSWNEQQVFSGQEVIAPGELSKILMKVPSSSIAGKWSLHVEGKEKLTQILIFQNSTSLTFFPQLLTILIQTSRPVYNAGQTVRFRAVLLDRNLKAFEDPVDVYVKDPRNLTMRRWPSRQPGDGVVNLSFDLPFYPLLGNWTILVKFGDQEQKKQIIVEQYFKPRFEVFVRLAQSFRSTEKWIDGAVVANMTNWRSVRGNCSLLLQLATNNDKPIPTRFTTIHSEFISNFTGVYQFQLPMSTVLNHTNITDKVIARIMAHVGDSFGWQIQDGWALAKVFKEKINVQFLGDQPFFFKPGMPFTTHIFVSYSDDHPLSDDELNQSSLTVRIHAAQIFILEFNGTKLMENSGVVEVCIMVPEEADTVKILANLDSNRGLTSESRITAFKHHSPRERFLHVDTSTQNAVPGEYIVLHVRNNFFITNFNYLVISKGLIVHSDREQVHDVSVPTITTFSLTASCEMAPVAKITIWAVDDKGEVISHSLIVPINPLTRHKVGINWNEHKDHTGGSAEMEMVGEKGSFFATMGIWEETFKMDAGNDLDESRILNQMTEQLWDSSRTNDDASSVVANVKKASTRSRYGHGTEVRLFSNSNIGPDSPTTLNYSELALLTDAMVFHHPSRASDSPPCKGISMKCLTGGCFSNEQRCDGIRDCADGSDETGCYKNMDPDLYFRIYRISRLQRFYDPHDGDWGWVDMRREGKEIRVFSFPKRPQSWVFSMFAVGKERGFGIMREKIQFDSTGPFTLKLDGPRVARMWEQMGLTVGIFNFHQSTVCILVTLPYSPCYQMILVEANGIVESYDPRRNNGIFQHIVWLPGNSSTDVHIPIIFSKIGTIEVTVEGSTQMQKDSDTLVIEVIPEGALISKHTSILLDLKDQARVYEFLNIHLDESPKIPYSIQRRFIFGTPMGHISITGDVFGPVFPEIPVGAETLLGLSVMGAETSAFNFAANIWSLQYLRLTNQLKDELLYKVLTAVNVEYASLVRYQTETGGFNNWIGSEKSVWLTAHALKNLWLATFQDWENLIYIDPKVIQKGVKWIMEYQSDSGAFSETGNYLHPLDPKLDPRSRHDWSIKYQNVSLTAHVVITLCDVMTALQGSLLSRAFRARANAVSYLERILENLDDSHDIAVVTWALIKANSQYKDLAFSKLSIIKRSNGNKVYWSREPISFNSLVYENNQKQYLQPKGDTKWDAHSVESTSYALMSYVKKDGIGIVQENIVRFLSNMRELDGGLISSLDSLAAMEALVMYSFRARVRDTTDMKIFIEQSSDNKKIVDLHIDNSRNLAEINKFTLDNLFGHLSVTGQGSGQALVQLNYMYGVDSEIELDVPPVPSFEFSLSARYSGRNNSYIKIESCQRWINAAETPTSGLTVVEIHLPSGYHIMQDKLIDLVSSRKIKNLRWALVTDKNVNFFFNKLETEMLCFNYQLERWYPVSNHSRYNRALIYELYQPERFKMNLFEVFPLYSLDICEVCGSFQCPYCPFYSSSRRITTSPIVSLVLVLTMLLFN